MLAYDERVEASKKFVHRRWYAADGEWRRAPMAGLWAAIVPAGRHVFEIVIERDDEFRCKTLVRRKRRCTSLLEAKEYAWVYLEPHLEAAREERFRPKATALCEKPRRCRRGGLATPMGSGTSVAAR